MTNTLIPLSDSSQRQMVLELLIGDMLDEGQDLKEIRSQLTQLIEELTES